jgi:hypothetical protein
MEECEHKTVQAQARDVGDGVQRVHIYQAAMPGSAYKHTWHTRHP